MLLYDTYSTLFFLGGMLALHLGIGILSYFFIYKFLIIAYDPTIIILLLFLLGGIILCDILCARMQMFSRYLIWLSIDETGIFCRKVGVKPWLIQWCDISTYGITGYSLANHSFALMFFSTDAQETYNEKHIVSINRNRIIIQIRKRSWETIKRYLPLDIKQRLEESMSMHRNCFCKRQKANTTGDGSVVSSSEYPQPK